MELALAVITPCILKVKEVVVLLVLVFFYKESLEQSYNSEEKEWGGQLSNWSVRGISLRRGCT